MSDTPNDNRVPPNPVNSSALCTTCALCCSGALHANTIVRPRDVEAVTRLGLTVVTLPDGDLAFAQPCTLLKQQTLCSAFPNHPPTCRSYKCALLEKYERGDVSLDKALLLVRRARQQNNEMKLSLASLGVTLVQHFRKPEAPGPAGEPGPPALPR